ncbi:hypothetical protein E4U42_005738 [Claviceps africana]|uniref:Uncharacterized protein n=1 Tax=Claviceps africana TaxID=83212 RepID=A0A8K0NJ18_9HYPO|nr:hypothetical protein E4U42_005738 [Claviceps africana]
MSGVRYGAGAAASRQSNVNKQSGEKAEEAKASVEMWRLGDIADVGLCPWSTGQPGT